MKMTLLASTSYTLKSFSSSPKRPLIEMLSDIELSEDDIRPYECTHQHSDLLYHYHGKTTSNRYSLSISIDEDKTRYIYYKKELYLESQSQSQSQFLRKVPYSKIPPLVYKIYSDLLILEKDELASQLLRFLETSPYHVQIRPGSFAHFRAYDWKRKLWTLNNATMIFSLDERRNYVEGIPFERVGSGGLLYYSPGASIELIEEDYERRKISSPIILGHELYHAYDSAHGLLDLRFVVSEEHSFDMVSEYRAVRFENQLRSNQGILKRRFYSSNIENPREESKDMLDLNNMTEVLPAPCIFEMSDESSRYF